MAVYALFAETRCDNVDSEVTVSGNRHRSQARFPTHLKTPTLRAGTGI